MNGKNQILKIIARTKVPLVSGEDFITLKCFPVHSKNFDLHSDKTDNLPKVGVVLQGQILKENDFTFETIKNYKKIFNENVEIILSTWTDEDEVYLRKFKDLGVSIITSNKPDRTGLLHLNYQIKSSRKGLEKAKELGCEYALKTRADQRFYAANIVEFLLNVLKTFPIDKNEKIQKERLIALSFNTFKYRIYGISDMFLFGQIDDVLKYWSVDYNDKEPSRKGEREQLDNHFYRSCETYIASEYLKKLGRESKFTLEDSLEVYAKYFCVIDKEAVEMFWPKYSNLNSRWESFEYSHMEELKFRDWLNLYYRNGIQPAYTIKNFKEKPQPKLNLSYFLKYPRRALERKNEGEKLTFF